MPGVHPNANAMPTSMAPSIPAGLRYVCTRYSESCGGTMSSLGAAAASTANFTGGRS